MGKRTVLDRYWSKVQVQQDGCWAWTGAISGDTGYGIFWDGTRLIGAHRFAYQLAFGPLTSSQLFVCHSCDHRACVNPAHLFVGSNQENVRDCIDKGRWQRPYVPTPRSIRPMTEERFWRKVQMTENGCWEWTGAKTNCGYGHLRLNNRNIAAHRFAYMLVNGAIPGGMVICHRCDNPSCVRPDHLFLGTVQENMRDCRDKGRMGEKRRLGLSNGAAKVTPQIALLIREAQQSGASRADLAKQFQVSVWTITQITTGRHWAVSPADENSTGGY